MTTTDRDQIIREILLSDPGDSLRVDGAGFIVKAYVLKVETRDLCNGPETTLHCRSPLVGLCTVHVRGTKPSDPAGYFSHGGANRTEHVIKITHAHRMGRKESLGG